MPKVTMFFDKDRVFLTPGQIAAICSATIPLIATALSTKNHVFNSNTSIDFFPIPYPAGARVRDPINIEVETAGKPGRVKKLTEEVVLQLREDILVVLRKLPGIPDGFSPQQLLWIKYADPRGPHV